MNTVWIWLLINVGYSAGQSAAPTLVVERFASAEDCEHVAAAARAYRNASLRCIQARVVRP